MVNKKNEIPLNQQVAIVTGGSSGIGACVVKELYKSGFKVYDFSRRDEIKALGTRIKTDVTDFKVVENSVKKVFDMEGRIDLLVNCAGFGISGAIEFTEEAEAKKQLDVNFFGMTNVCRAVLPYMRAANKGRIINISSVAAICSIPFQAYYSVSKSAINTYTAALANEVHPYGITATAIMPGDIKTNFTTLREKSFKGDEEYGNRISNSVNKMEKDEINGMSPEVAGKYICKIAMKNRVKPLYAIGFSYKAVCVLVKLLPCRIANYLLRKLYA